MNFCDQDTIAAVREINSALQGNRLGNLTRQEAKMLYGPVSILHAKLQKLIAEAEGCMVLNSWRRDLQEETERLGDILEALAWGSDEELRVVIESSISELRLK